MRDERGRLVATSPALTARLHALARHGSQPERGDGDIGGTLELCRGENRPPFIAHVIPLAPIRTAAIFDLDRPAAAFFVVDPAAGLGAQPRKARSRENRNQPSNGTHSPVSRDRLARLARRGLALQKYKFRLSPHVIGTDDVRAGSASRCGFVCSAACSRQSQYRHPLRAAIPSAYGW